MREYETVIITKPDLPESQFNQTGEKIKAIIEKRDGRLFFARNMGRKSLSYAIKRQTKGVYTCFDYASEGPTVSDIERMLRIEDGVLRFLTVLKKEEVDVEARAAEIVARGEDRAPESQEEAKAHEKRAESKPERKEEKAEGKAEEKAEGKAEEKAEEKAEGKAEEKSDEAKEPGKEE